MKTDPHNITSLILPDGTTYTPTKQKSYIKALTHPYVIEFVVILGIYLTAFSCLFYFSNQHHFNDPYALLLAVIISALSALLAVTLINSGREIIYVTYPNSMKIDVKSCNYYTPKSIMNKGVRMGRYTKSRIIHTSIIPALWCQLRKIGGAK